MKPDFLFHISEETGISIFEPRPSPRLPDSPPMVWGIEKARLCNYLLPRDCPRVTFYADATTSDEDKQRFLLGHSKQTVIAIESGWFKRVQECQLIQYRFSSTTFRLHNQTAGYWISETAVKPVEEKLLQTPLQDLIDQGVELRIMPSLWALRDEVVHSTLQFSIIRMRNAQAHPIKN